MLFGGICFITDRGLSSLTVEEQVKVVLDAGVKWIQYREKGLSRREIYLQAERLKALTEEYNAAFTVNDHADIALAVEADGLHLGQDDLPLKYARKIMGGKTIGISTHSMRQAEEAWRGGADYIGFGPIFETSTKDAGEARGVTSLSEIAHFVENPVVAIGGINLGNVGDIFREGASAAALASGILKGGDPHAAAKEFVKIADEAL